MLSPAPVRGAKALPLSVIPAKAGTHGHGRPTWRATTSRIAPMGPGLRRDDEAGTNTQMKKAPA